MQSNAKKDDNSKSNSQPKNGSSDADAYGEE